MKHVIAGILFMGAVAAAAYGSAATFVTLATNDLHAYSGLLPQAAALLAARVRMMHGHD